MADESADESEESEETPRVADRDASGANAGGASGRIGRIGRLLAETDRVQLLIAVLIGLALVVFVRGLTLGVTGEDRYRLPDEIESVSPVPDAVQAQPGEAIVVDLDSGYTGVLVVDGRELETVDISQIEQLPGTQLDLPAVAIFEPGNSTLRFVPSDESEVPPFAPGTHSVLVNYWPVVDGPQFSLTYAWTFNVN